MYRYGQPLATLARTLRCAELCPGEGGAVPKFYLRRDLAVRHNGSMSAKRVELSSEMKFVGFRPSKPRRLYELVVEETSSEVNELGQYKSNGFSFKVPVVGSTSKPNDSRTTTPSKTLSIISEIQTGKASSLPFNFIQDLPLFTLITPAPVITFSSLTASIPSSSASFFGKTVKLEPVSTKALTLVDFFLSNSEISTSTHEWPIPTTEDESDLERLNSFPNGPREPSRLYELSIEGERFGGERDE